MIRFQELGSSRKVRGRRVLRAWLDAVARSEGFTAGDITIVFTTDDQLLEFNKTYLSHDTFTDIITFDQSQGKVVAGDILISIDRVLENAASFSQTFETELARVMAHGVLHLCGYKDKNRSQKERMRAAEERALKFKRRFSL